MPTAASYTTEQSGAQPRHGLHIVKAEHITAKPMTIEPQPAQAEVRTSLQVVPTSHHINSRELSSAQIRELVTHATESPDNILQFPQPAEVAAQAPAAPLEQDPTLQVLNQIETVNNEAEQAAKAVTTIDPMQAQLHAKVAGQQLEALEPDPTGVATIPEQPKTVAETSGQTHQPTVAGKFLSHLGSRGNTRDASHGNALVEERLAKAA